MYRKLSADKDTYITNRVIRNNFRATDANTGRAGTIDIFKLYEESTLPGTSSGVIEVSRGLIHFDLNPIRALTSSYVNINDSSFKCDLVMYDISHGQPKPENFKMIVFPLSQSFDEGIGRLTSYDDIDAANFITASHSGGSPIPWNITGSDAAGALGATSIDIISTGDLNDGNGTVNLFKEQTFTNGDENLSIDVTPVISGVLAGQIPDFGFRISLSGALETDTQTYFIKRFASRHVTSSRLRPRLIVRFDDSVNEDTENLFFDLSGSLILENSHRGVLSNLVSGSSLTQITGSNSLRLLLSTGSYSLTSSASQRSVGLDPKSGSYSATFVIPSSDSSIVSGTTTLSDHVKVSGSLVFARRWSSLDETVDFLSDTITINAITRNSFEEYTRDYYVSVSNNQSVYKSSQKARFRVHVFDPETGPTLRKVPFERKSKILRNMYYRIRDYKTKDIVIPFDDTYNSTLLSTDSDGMFFELYMSDLDVGEVYEIEFMVKEQGQEMIFDDAGARFRVEI